MNTQTKSPTTASSRRDVSHQSRSSLLTDVFHALHTLAPTKQPLTALDNAVSSPSYTRNTGALHQLSQEDGEKARSIFLTLHVLFPNHLLPALDILDRGLATRLVMATEPAYHVSDPVKTYTNTHEEAPSPSEPTWDVYYVQSSSAVMSRQNPRHKKPSATATHYEVRLDSWNCSCPAFSVEAFQSVMSLYDDENDGDDAADRGQNYSNGTDMSVSTGARINETDWQFGGAATLPSSGKTPICKHILAAVLAKSAPGLFDSGLTERRVTREELAGWGAGWGDFGYG